MIVGVESSAGRGREADIDGIGAENLRQIGCKSRASRVVGSTVTSAVTLPSKSSNELHLVVVPEMAEIAGRTIIKTRIVSAAPSVAKFGAADGRREIEFDRRDGVIQQRGRANCRRSRSSCRLPSRPWCLLDHSGGYDAVRPPRRRIAEIAVDVIERCGELAMETLLVANQPPASGTDCRRQLAECRRHC